MANSCIDCTNSIHVDFKRSNYSLPVYCEFLVTIHLFIRSSKRNFTRKCLISRLHQFLVCLNKKFPIKIMSHALFPYNVNRIQLSKIPHNLVDRIKILSYEKKFHWRKSVEFNYLKSPMTWLVV